MPDYFSWDPHGPDLSEKHTVEAKGIQRWTKGRGFFRFLEPWKKDCLWKFTSETRLTRYKNVSGKGSLRLEGLELDGSKDKQTFWCYENVESFLNEIQRRGVEVDPELPESWGKW